MRLRELEQAEVSYLIINGWARYKRGEREIWYHPEHCPKESGMYLTQEDAVKWQKAKDRGTDVHTS